MAREIDSEALRAYRDNVKGQLEKLEDVLIPQLKNEGEAKLGNLPAFGQMAGSDTARQKYETFHEGTWNNLQSLREALNGIMKTLDESGKLSDESDEMASSDMNNYDNELEQ